MGGTVRNLTKDARRTGGIGPERRGTISREKQPLERREPKVQVPTMGPGAKSCVDSQDPTVDATNLGARHAGSKREGPPPRPIFATPDGGSGHVDDQFSLCTMAFGFGQCLWCFGEGVHSSDNRADLLLHYEFAQLGKVIQVDLPDK